MALAREELRAIETAGLDADEYLTRFGDGDWNLFDFEHFGTAWRVYNRGFHCLESHLSCVTGFVARKLSEHVLFEYSVRRFGVDKNQ
jgi:hypothetical protein